MTYIYLEAVWELWFVDMVINALKGHNNQKHNLALKLPPINTHYP